MNGAEFLKNLTFMGGTCLRDCYGSVRLSEDLDKIANTCGNYDAYRQNVELTDELVLALPEPNTNLQHNECFNCDTNELAKNVSADVVYIDPPYNSCQYSDAYHLIENIAHWQKPEVFGVAKKMDRTALKRRHGYNRKFSDFVPNVQYREKQ